MKNKFLLILMIFLVCICSTGCDYSDTQATQPPIPPTSSPTKSPTPPNKFDPITISGLKKTWFRRLPYYKIEGTLKDSSGKELTGEYITISVIGYRKKGGHANVLTKFTKEAKTDSMGKFKIKVFVPPNRGSSDWLTEYKDKVDIEVRGPRVMKAFKKK